MYRTVANAIRPAARSWVRPAARAGVARAFSATSCAHSEEHHVTEPSIFGQGGKPGEIPTNFEQATGVERFELLGQLQGTNVFDVDSPLDSSRVGTKKDPILVPSLDTMRIVGCTGSPADSHGVLWFPVHKDKQARCGECGSVYALNYITEASISAEPLK
ncbi:COX5B-domain-containing protein [Fistulina hepatica ATCC 64428]|nr:COX5B-domain-containing protein [Fistulina hepatica ATCC 64428]